MTAAGGLSHCDLNAYAVRRPSNGRRIVVVISALEMEGVTERDTTVIAYPCSK